ncbi:MAG: PD40 domain-containing protein [Anaerolineae bacterium]|nr:PD40 domain-containing protein [Anaerolineae bacterium]
MKFEYHRLLRCAGSMLLAIGLLGLALGMVQGAGSLTRVTTASPANRDSGFPSVNADGSKVVFMSDSDFFNQGIGTLETEIWLYDTKTLTLTRLTTKAGDGFRQSLLPSISAAGSKVVFQSDSDFLGQGIQSLNQEVWLYGTTTMVFTRVTTSPDRQLDIFVPKISADGRKIVFQSDSDFFGQGIQPYQDEIWLYDTQTMTFTRLTTASHPNRRSNNPNLTADGTKITFSSDSDFLGSGIPAGQSEVWLYDTGTMSLTRITTASHPNRSSYNTNISADGKKIAFQSDSDFLGQGIPDNQTEIWLYDMATKALTRITTASDENRDSYISSINADGTKIAITSDSDFFGQGIPDSQEEIWLYNTATMTLTRITTASAPLRDSSTASLSADGTTIAFNSLSDFLGQGIPTDQLEIWLYRQNDIPNEGIFYKTYLPLVLKLSPQF